MPETKKTAKAPRSKTTKPKGVKAKPASKVKTSFVAKPVAKNTKPLPKPEAKKPEALALIETTVKKVRGPNKKAKGSFAELIKKQAELEEIKKSAKAELKKEYDNLLKESEKVKSQYKELFSEAIESAPKTRTTSGKRSKGKVLGLKPFTLSEVKDFLEQKQQGYSEIKIQGRRPKSISRIEDAYRHSEDAEDILKILNA